MFFQFFPLVFIVGCLSYLATNSVLIEEKGELLFERYYSEWERVDVENSVSTDELITKLHEIEERIKRYKKFLIIIENSYDLPTVDKTDDKTDDKKDKGEEDTNDNELIYYFYVDDSM